MATTKELPHNDEAEKAVIGAMIASSSARTDILNTLDEEDFYEKNVNHRHIFKAIYNLFNKGISVDISSIVNELDANMKVLDASGGVEYLYEVQELYIGDRVAMHHRDIVKDLSLSRRFIKTMQNCINGFADKEFEDVSHYVIAEIVYLFHQTFVYMILFVVILHLSSLYSSLIISHIL